MDTKKVGLFIATKRKECGLTQLQLAEKLYITDKAVSKWERGLACPDISALQPLSEILGVSVIELLNGEVPTSKDDNLVIQESLSTYVDVTKKICWKKFWAILLIISISIGILLTIYSRTQINLKQSKINDALDSLNWAVTNHLDSTIGDVNSFNNLADYNNALDAIDNAWIKNKELQFLLSPSSRIYQYCDELDIQIKNLKIALHENILIQGESLTFTKEGKILVSKSLKEIERIYTSITI